MEVFNISSHLASCMNYTAPLTFDPAAPTTFLFLSDPQQWRDEDISLPDSRLLSCSDLNVALNNLDSDTWPTGFNLTVSGKPIGPISAVFFGGDLTNNGGGYSSLDQVEHKPPTYHGGEELQRFRSLYQPGYSDYAVTKLKYGPKYFGLGNHDVLTDYHPAVGWKKGRWDFDFSLPENYWRYQMWDFISQIHTGFNQVLLGHTTSPVYGLEWHNIHSDTGRGTFDYEDYSLNYVVDMGPVDVFQLHRYGGDSDGDRATGLGWLKGKLEERGPTRPIIIVQHYLFSETVEDPDPITPTWTASQRNAMLDILAPYNIIAFLVGHNHGIGPMPNWVPVPWHNPTRYVPELRPGAAFFELAALIRVTPSTLDVVYGRASKGKLTWSAGNNFPVPFANQIWEEVADLNGNYFGTLKNIYVDTRALSAPDGKVIISAGLVKTTGVGPEPGNRLTWRLIAAYANGTAQETINVGSTPGNNYFPGEGGMSKIYIDTSPVVCPSGSDVIGVFFWQKSNRVAPGLIVRNRATKIETRITDEHGTSYFPGSDGSTNLYADTNMVARPNRSDVPATLQMGGVALYQKGGNRVGLKVLYK
ncbi:hypothetical protein BC834DRAFT_1045913 [Gloeopeniophorella convolvens]|nr:hypothetical protein BC834DRAFT_1045913 [Gloeopeniophorella convolvens]